MDRAALAQHLVSREQLQRQLERELLSTGVKAFDCILEGLPRGAVTELYGPSGCGKTSFLHTLLASATRAGEYCAYVDATASFDPFSASASGTDFPHLLWVRCSEALQAMKAADLLVHSGGWGVVVLDIADVPARVIRNLPDSYWYRFRRAVENTSAVFLVLEREPYVKNCAVMALEIPAPAGAIWKGGNRDFRLLHGAEVRIQSRKPFRPEKMAFQAGAV
jgi:hypothetical protein